jgi:hypothetical protein
MLGNIQRSIRVPHCANLMWSDLGDVSRGKPRLVWSEKNVSIESTHFTSITHHNLRHNPYGSQLLTQEIHLRQECTTAIPRVTEEGEDGLRRFSSRSTLSPRYAWIPDVPVDGSMACHASLRRAMWPRRRSSPSPSGEEASEAHGACDENKRLHKRFRWHTASNSRSIT